MDDDDALLVWFGVDGGLEEVSFKAGGVVKHAKTRR